MKFLLFLIGIALTSAQSTFVLEPVNTLQGSTQALGFDGAGNLYVSTYVRNGTSEGYQLSKLSPTREFIWSVELPETDYLSRMAVTSYGDVYFLLGFQRSSLALLRDGSVSIITSELAEFPEDLFYLSGNDYFIYAGADSLNIIKPNTTTPIPIKGLEIYKASPWPGYSITDRHGNIHFAVTGKFEYWIATLTVEALQQDVPNAKLLLAQDVAVYQVPFDVIIDKNDDFWVTVTDDLFISYNRKLVDGKWQTLTTHPKFPDVSLTLANDRIYVIAGWINELSAATIYYFTLDGKVVEIPSLSELSERRLFGIDTLVNSDGDIYFKTNYNFSSSLGRTIFMKANDSEPTPFTVPNQPGDYLIYWHMDDNDNIWFTTHEFDMFYLEKGETIAKLVGERDPDDNYCPRMATNHVTKDVYALCKKLYLVVKK